MVKRAAVTGHALKMRCYAIATLIAMTDETKRDALRAPVSKKRPFATEFAQERIQIGLPVVRT